MAGHETAAGGRGVRVLLGSKDSGLKMELRSPKTSSKCSLAAWDLPRVTGQPLAQGHPTWCCVTLHRLEPKKQGVSWGRERTACAVAQAPYHTPGQRGPAGLLLGTPPSGGSFTSLPLDFQTRLLVHHLLYHDFLLHHHGHNPGLTVSVTEMN